MDKKEKIRDFLKGKYAVAGYLLAGWLALWGIIFLVGNLLESVILFLFFYNLIYPVATLVGCYMLAKKKGVVLYMPIAMVLVSVVLFFATELVKFAMPNAIVITIVAVFFGTGFGNIMHGNDDKKRK